MAFRKYQQDIYNAVLNKGNYVGSNVCVTSDDNVTTVTYYRTTIAVIDHNKKTVHYDNGGYHNAATTARINAVKAACENRFYLKEV